MLTKEQISGVPLSISVPAWHQRATILVCDASTLIDSNWTSTHLRIFSCYSTEYVKIAPPAPSLSALSSMCIDRRHCLRFRAWTARQTLLIPRFRRSTETPKDSTRLQLGPRRVEYQEAAHSSDVMIHYLLSLSVIDNEWETSIQGKENG